jgi:Carboxypeptidase regulatory-like domain
MHELACARSTLISLEAPDWSCYSENWVQRLLTHIEQTQTRCSPMKRFFLLTTSILFLGMIPSAQAGEILGRVTTARGQAIVSIRVMVTDQAGRVISSSITNADGAYDVKGVAPGRYAIKLLPLTGGTLGGLSNVRVGPHGSKVDLIVPEHALGFVLRDACHSSV